MGRTPLPLALWVLLPAFWNGGECTAPGTGSERQGRGFAARGAPIGGAHAPSPLPLRCRAVELRGYRGSIHGAPGFMVDAWSGEPSVCWGWALGDPLDGAEGDAAQWQRRKSQSSLSRRTWVAGDARKTFSCNLVAWPWREFWDTLPQALAPHPSSLGEGQRATVGLGVEVWGERPSKARIRGAGREEGREEWRLQRGP